MRLNKFLSFCGVCSRRKADELIKAGKVKVNGKVITELGIQVDPEKDKVEVNGKLVKPPKKLYYLFYKPRGYITSLYDPYNKKTIAEFIKKLPLRVFPVGRLDRDSEGLLLLTNDGDLANKLLHPRYEVKRTYLVWVTPKLSEEKISNLLKNGVIIANKRVKPLKFELFKKDGEEWVYRVVVKEGVKREVRKMVGFLGGRVHRLKRIEFGPLKIGNLKPGEIRPLSEKEVKKLYDFLNLEKSL
ncbi:MAG: rRNA pseudouridine synthase [Thermodesulfobacteria bacterium]|nr:rRNA pseudouridine synthase [Thermodesulfobacteriota bacterium]